MIQKDFLVQSDPKSIGKCFSLSSAQRRGLWRRQLKRVQTTSSRRKWPRKARGTRHGFLCAEPQGAIRGPFDWNTSLWETSKINHYQPLSTPINHYQPLVVMVSSVTSSLWDLIHVFGGPCKNSQSRTTYVVDTSCASQVMRMA